VQEDTTTPPPAALATVDEAQQAPQALVPQSLLRVGVSGGFTQMPLSEALDGLNRINGGAMVLLAVQTRALEVQTEDQKSPIRSLVASVDDLRTKYHEESMRCAVLDQQLSSLRQHKNLQQYMTTIGGIVAGVGLPLLCGGSIGSGATLTAVGLATLAGSFWKFRTESEK
jgi:hypothetical protein